MENSFSENKILDEERQSLDPSVLRRIVKKYIKYIINTKTVQKELR